MTKIKPVKLGHWFQGIGGLQALSSTMLGRLGYLKTSRNEITMCFHFTARAASLKKKGINTEKHVHRIPQMMSKTTLQNCPQKWVSYEAKNYCFEEEKKNKKAQLFERAWRGEKKSSYKKVLESDWSGGVFDFH